MGRTAGNALAWILVVPLLAIAQAAAAEPGGPLDSGTIVPGARWSHAFDSPGDHAYHCHPHPWMQATVLVRASNGSEPRTYNVEIVDGQDEADWRFEPSFLLVRVGDRVAWWNNGTVDHTVASESAAGDGHSHDAMDGHDHTHDGDVDGSRDAPIPWAVPLGAALLVRRRRR